MEKYYALAQKHAMDKVANILKSQDRGLITRSEAHDRIVSIGAGFAK